ncbi:MAG: UvrD-helicase domain-containing protein [Chloroflexota bacterium]|nr:UvrD-helicase domain-containing protein [Chloroflexota bacterium]
MITNPDALLANLNEPQQRAVETTNGPVLILAGAGSGKTRVIVHRIAYLMLAKRVPPWHILGVTFTNKAAGEMRDRVRELAGPIGDNVLLSTFHAFCSRILRRELRRLGWEEGFTIYDDADQLSVIKDVLKALDINEKRLSPRAVLNTISRAKDELITPHVFAEHAQGPFEEAAARVYRRYQDTLRNANALDFNDLIMFVVQLFREFPDVREHYQDRFRYIMVDEYQDTNHAQYELVRLLSAKYRNLCVVGDDDQGIYSWRGADLRNILDFEREYDDAAVIKLEQNYRSTQNILDAAHGIISRLPNRRDKRLWTENGGGAPLVVLPALDEEDEARLIVNTVRRLQDEGLGLSDCVVMYRTNAQSRALEDALVTYGIPYQLVGGVAFYQRREVKDALAYLRVVHNLSDSLNFRRIVNVPPRGIGAKTFAALSMWAEMQGTPPAEAVLRLAAGDVTDPLPVTARARVALESLGHLLSGFRREMERLPLSEFVKTVVRESGYLEHIRNNDNPEEAIDREENLDELVAAAARFDEVEPPQGLSLFLHEATLVADVDRMNEDGGLTLMTMHNAKGLEFPAVFVAGMEEELFPHIRSLDDPEQLAEERRLCYVALTRAKERLYLLYAARRYSSQSLGRIPSRFITELPMELVTGPGMHMQTPVESVWQGSRSASPPQREPASQEQKYRDGDRVRHTVFGEGRVVSSKITDTDEEVTVAFPDIGIKRLSASFAPLEKLG